MTHTREPWADSEPDMPQASVGELLRAIEQAEKHLSGWFMVEDADLIGQALDVLREAISKAKGE